MTRNVSHTNLLFLSFLLLFVTCKKDDTPDVADTDDYLGMWQCNEYDLNQQLIATFQIEIRSHPDFLDRVLIDNFNQLGQGFLLEGVVDNASIDLPQQVLSSTAINGGGIITNHLNNLELQYNIDNGTGQPEIVEASCARL
jgi:hypothetical protein